MAQKTVLTTLLFGAFILWLSLLGGCRVIGVDNERYGGSTCLHMEGDYGLSSGYYSQPNPNWGERVASQLLRLPDEPDSDPLCENGRYQDPGPGFTWLVIAGFFDSIFSIVGLVPIAVFALLMLGIWRPDKIDSWLDEHE